VQQRHDGSRNSHVLQGGRIAHRNSPPSSDTICAVQLDQPLHLLQIRERDIDVDLGLIEAVIHNEVDIVP
jgi:hypothetical protein